MQNHHYIMLAVVLFVGYVLGIKFPAFGAKIPFVGK